MQTFVPTLPGRHPSLGTLVSPPVHASRATAARTPCPHLGAAAILQLQRQIGNAAVRALLQGGGPPQHAVARRIQAARGRGRRLDPRTRRRLERSYGADLSDVQVHTDMEADTLSRAVNARAFTSSSNIFFTQGAYSPSTADGFLMLAHEVAHVVQQSEGPVPAADFGALRVSRPTDDGEVMAESAAVLAASGARAEPSRGAVPQQRAGHAARGPRSGIGPRGMKRDGISSKGASSREGASLARTAAGTAGGVVTVQRAPQPLVPLGDFDLMFNPSSALDFTPPGSATPTSRRVNDTSSTATFANVPRGSSGTVTLDVAMQWFRRAGPAGRCDLCEILRRVLTFEIPIPIPLVPNITIEPADSVIQQCRRLVRVDPEGIRPLLDRLEQVASDPCGALLELLGASGLRALCVLPSIVLAPLLAPVQVQILRAVLIVRRALDECRRATPGGGGSAPGPLAGNARAIMTATFVSDPAGQLVFSGLSPAPSQDGLGARMLIPVESARTPVPTGGTVQQQPTLVTTTGSAGTQGRLFTVNLLVDPAPADADYDCRERFGPFRVGKAVFEDEDGQIRAIRDFFFGMHPKVREDIEEGRGNLVITGRASKTDTQANNLKLGQRRADRVEDILRNFTGNTPNLRARSLGELGAQTVGCPDTPDNPARGAVCEDPNERRTDVKANGTIREAGDIDPKCSGHLGEETPTGVSNPVTEAEGPETAASTAAIQPTLRLFSRGEPVARLQQLLNEMSKAGLTVDGDFGPQTQSAVTAFQAGEDLQPDGIVGPKTWERLLSQSL